MRQITSKTRFRIHSEHYENVSKCIVQSVYACISSYVWSLIEKVILDLIVRVFRPSHPATEDKAVENLTNTIGLFSDNKHIVALSFRGKKESID